LLKYTVSGFFETHDYGTGFRLRSTEFLAQLGFRGPKIMANIQVEYVGN